MVASLRPAALLALTGLLLGALPAPGLAAPAQHSEALTMAARLVLDESRMAAAREERSRLGAQPRPDDVLGQVRRTFGLFNAGYEFRVAARDQQAQIETAATDPALAAAVRPLLPPTLGPAFSEAVGAVQAIRRLAGITDPSQVRYRLRAFDESTPPDQLAGYYRLAGSRWDLDWTYLASINFIESDFGRDVGPSSAGALGPMQFEPATWQEYGNGQDVMDPRASILAAAHYLADNGAPQDMSAAVFAYNHDRDYVKAVLGYAAAVRADPLWLESLYYWSTYG